MNRTIENDDDINNEHNLKNVDKLKYIDVKVPKLCTNIM